MTVLSQTQMTAYAAAVGFPNPRLMAAIAMAESGGRSDVVNSIGCVGPLQINQPVHVKTHPTWTQAWLKEPLNNFRAGKVIYDSQGLGAWEAYTNGSYKKYYGGSTATATPVVDIPLDPLTKGIAEGVAGSDSLTSAVSMAAKSGIWISNPHNWLRILYVALGAGALFIAVQRGLISSGPGKEIVSGLTTKKVPTNAG